MGDQDDDELDSQIGVEPGADVGDDNQMGGFKNKRGYKKNADKITAKFLTKYERARILGTRALQLSKNAPLMIDGNQETDPYKLAEEELRQQKIPFIIRRYLPDKT